MKIRSLLESKNRSILSLSVLVGVYIIVRFFFGVHSPMNYVFVFVLLLLRYSFEKIALAFLLLCVVVYVFGKFTEANHYLSFVYGFMFFSLLKYLFIVLKERFNK